ncbi:unnamed protein product [Ilex paraguariensis]|uniref:Protein kinase domain-containing protein n=2 Tax=Ilex paraguariensis TaxID=185542 RepID=A0ABC8TYS4_9AQUA
MNWKSRPWGEKYEADLRTRYSRPGINPKPKTSKFTPSSTRATCTFLLYITSTSSSPLPFSFIIDHQTHHHHTPYLSKLIPPMYTITLHISFFLYLLFSITTAAAAISDTANAPPYSPSDYFLLNCGLSSSSNDADGRTWEGDARSKFSPSNISITSLEYKASEQKTSVNQVPYMTARIFRSEFTYTFPITVGPKFIRLYFYPVNYSDLDIANSFFSVTSGGYTLLSNFSAFLTVSAMKPAVASLRKEFIVNVRNNQKLNITFSPSPNSYAFVNGIEVVSIPENLYIRGSDYQIPLVPNQISFNIDNTSVLETLYRLNVGGNEVSITDDTGMFRLWLSDDAYTYAAYGFTPHREVPIQYTKDTPPYTAPKIVYTTTRTMGNQSLTYNLTWRFPVDSGFYYLLRLHFCEIQLEVTLENQRVFIIYINNQTAQRGADVIQWSGGTGIPVFKDYVIMVTDPDGRRSKQDLWLAMYPELDFKPQYADAILNGLEIFKLSGTDDSLAGANPELVLSPPPGPFPLSPQKKNNKKTSTLPVIIGSVVGGGSVLVFILGFLIVRRRRRVKDLGSTQPKSSWVPLSDGSKSTKTSGSSLPSDLCRRFSLEEITSATCNFDDNFVIGAGGFGNVYKGHIDNGATTVAIKRLNPSSNQGIHEFQTEIGMLSKLRHLHLVSLIGYCNDNREMILVYDYMAHGTLRDHLYKSKKQHLPWKQRLQICIGAARGLHYLHTGATRTIIHRDVKSTNILLDEKWVAKVSDFGLSKLGPKDVGHSHVSTVVKGSFGYVDPEYYKRQQLTEKSDVYSFGVVLFEVLCARPAIIPNFPKEQVSLAEWARNSYRKGTLDRIIDTNLKGEIAPECLRKFGEVGESCLRDNGIDRPGMNDVVWGLEFALQLQEAAEKMAHGGGWLLPAALASPSVPLLHGEATTTDDDEVFTASVENMSRSTVSSERLKSETVFSEILNPVGR